LNLRPLVTDRHGLSFVTGRRILALSCTNVTKKWSSFATDGHRLEGVFGG